MLTTLFRSPEFYPQWMDFENNALHFVHMSRESYRNSVFLDVRTQHLGDPIRKINLDEVLRASTTNGIKSQKQLEAIVSDPSVSRYSKNWSIPFNATARQQEMEQLDQQWGKEAEVAIHWMEERVQAHSLIFNSCYSPE